MGAHGIGSSSLAALLCIMFSVRVLNIGTLGLKFKEPRFGSQGNV